MIKDLATMVGHLSEIQAQVYELENHKIILPPIYENNKLYGILYSTGTPSEFEFLEGFYSNSRQAANNANAILNVEYEPFKGNKLLIVSLKLEGAVGIVTKDKGD